MVNDTQDIVMGTATRIPKMESFAPIVNGKKTLNIITKLSILNGTKHSRMDQVTSVEDSL